MTESVELELAPKAPTGEDCLAAAAYDLADRYRSSGESSAREWEGQWRNMIAALRIRCPGHSQQA